MPKSAIYCPPKRGESLFFSTLNDHILQYVGTNPYLGVTLSEDLTFDAHVGNITKKGSPSRLKKLAYLTLVRSGLEYASVVWDPFLQREIERLEKIQAGRHALSQITTGGDVDSPRPN